MPLPETNPPTFTPLEFPSAAKMNEVRDWINALLAVTLVTDENGASAIREDDEYGPMNDQPGPSVTFKAGPDGMVQIYLYAWIRVGLSGSHFAYASYEIERTSDNEIVVGPSDLRSIMTRDTLASSRQFVWREELTPGETYTCRMVYRAQADSSDPSAEPWVDTSYRKLMVDRVFLP